MMDPLTVTAHHAAGDLLWSACTLFVFGFFWAILIAVANWVWMALRTAGGILIDIFSKVGRMIEDALGPVWGVVKKMGAKVWEFWKNVIEWGPDAFRYVLVELPKKLADIIAKISTWLDHILQPALDIIRQVIDWVDLIWEKVIEDILLWMDRARHILLFLDKLGVEWAGWLEERLWQIENRIYGAFEFIRGWLNQIESFLYTVVDPNGFIRRIPLLGSLMRTGEDVMAILVDVGAAEDHAERRAAIEGEIPVTTNALVLAAFKDGSIFADPAVRAAADEFNRGDTLKG